MARDWAVHGGNFQGTPIDVARDNLRRCLVAHALGDASNDQSYSIFNRISVLEQQVQIELELPITGTLLPLFDLEQVRLFYCYLWVHNFEYGLKSF